MPQRNLIMPRNWLPGNHDRHTLNHWKDSRTRKQERRKANLALTPEPCPVCGQMMIVDADAGLYCTNWRNNPACRDANLQRRHNL